MKRLLIGLLACLPLAGYAQDEAAGERMRDAERRLQQAAQEIAEASSELAGESMRHVFKTVRRPDGGRRAMLGINVGRIRIERDDGSSEELGVAGDGVEIYGVTPGGPADAAGLRSGDILLALDGQRLAGHDDPPERRLIELMRDVEPGATVRLTYRRGDRERKAEVVTQEFAPMAFAFGDEDFDFEFNGEHIAPEILDHLPRFMHRRHGIWRGLELVPLTAKLGSYFGTDSGLLVVRAPQHDVIPLEEGDVIKQIAGATPKSPPDAMRLLRFYEPGDQVVIDVLRQKRNRTFKITIPEKTGD